MSTVILRTAARHLGPALVVFALWLLWRGHNAPGGGFIAGLVAGAALVLYAIAFGPDAAARRLRIAPPRLIGLGLALALGVGLTGPLFGRAFLGAGWVDVPGVGPLGTPLIFDVGVFAVVVGAVGAFVRALWPADPAGPAGG